MGKGGGGGSQPQVSTAYQTNLPEYAEPYVKNMLGAAEAQVYAPGKTGFREYQPYSTDPTKYFAGPSNLQQGVYGEAAQMQSPGQFAPATGLAGMAGMGQLGTTGQASTLGQIGLAGALPAFGAGQQYASQVTNPSAFGAYMSPYQQQVTDIAKMNAVREAQMAGQQANLGAARQGTYGGARQALMGAEREKNLLSNLSNIQAQGSQSAYDKAMQAQQFGANLGLQGIQTGLQGVSAGMQGVGAQQAGYAGAGQAASTLGQLGGAQQQADLARMGFQQQTGQQQQAYQQNIINQAIQDYATQQQYPFMQLSTMSNLLRGLPMQGMTTQQYQAQPTSTQQLLGLAGTGASLYGAMKREGGTIKEYAAGGTIRGLENKIDDIGDAGGAKGLQALLAQTKSPKAKELIMERMREEGIAAAPTGKLGTNMAGGGIIAFEEGGNVPGFYAGELIDGFGTSPEAMAMDQLRVDEAKLVEDRKRYEQIKNMSPVAAERMLKENPNLEVRAPVVAAAPAAPIVKKDDTVPPTTPPTTTDTGKSTGLDAVLEDRRRRLGIDGPGEKNEAFMKALEERQTGLGKQNESDRYLRMAEAFAKFGSTAGPIGATAAEALGGFAKGEAAARKDQDKMQLEGMKMQADLEKARRAEARGDLDSAEKFYSSAEDRKNRLDVANQSANKQVELIERAMKDPKFMEALRSTKGLDSKAQQTALVNYTKWESNASLTDPNLRKLIKAAKDGNPKATQDLIDYKEQVYNQFLTRAGGTSSMGGGNTQLNKDQQALLDKYK
jgi:hypothetical protein